MIQIFKMALRDLMRNRRRSFFSALALGLGLGLLLLIASFFRGEMRGAMNTAINLQSGHLQVRVKTYDETKTSLAYEDLIENPQQVAAKIASLSPIKVATPRLFASGYVAAGNQSIGVRIVGVDPASDANDPYRKGLVSGEFIQADDREGVLMGKVLADKLNLKPGDKITLLANTSNGDVDEQGFLVRGTYSTRTPAFDETVLLMPLAKAQAFTQAGNRASTIFILLKDQDQYLAVSEALKANTQYVVLNYLELNELLAQTEQLSSGYIYLIYMIVLAVTATVIINTLIMAVFERTREIGILSALGMKSPQIMAMFFVESALLAFGGIVIGLVLGGLMVYYATTVGFYIGNMGLSGILIGERIYAYLTVNDTIMLTVITLIISLLAALYPALLAAQMEPVEALRGGKQA